MRERAPHLARFVRHPRRLRIDAEIRKPSCSSCLRVKKNVRAGGTRNLKKLDIFSSWRTPTGNPLRPRRGAERTRAQRNFRRQVEACLPAPVGSAKSSKSLKKRKTSLVTVFVTNCLLDRNLKF